MAISNELSNRVIHQMRTCCDAIVIGIGTAIQDDPMLTPRGVKTIRVPHRYVLDSSLRLPLESQLVRTARDIPTTVITDVLQRDDCRFAARAKALRAQGVIVDDDVPVRGKGLDLFEAISMGSLHAKDRTHVLFEPGPTLAKSILSMMHRLWIIESTTVHSPHGLKAPKIPPHFLPVATLNLAGDILTEYLNTQSPAFFAPVPSADFMLAREQAADA
jgi:diaminohydroxyphosphoribosylaminopyrimidine deaminase/5-amino-6-(5-phosphoribosylamino)uracil reductase